MKRKGYCMMEAAGVYALLPGIVGSMTLSCAEEDGHCYNNELEDETASLRTFYNQGILPKTLHLTFTKK